MIYHGWEMLSGAPHPLITVSLQPPHPSMLGGFLESDGKAGLETHSNSHVRATLTSFRASLSLPFRFAAVAGFQSVHGVQPGAHPARGLAPQSWSHRNGTGLSDVPGPRPHARKRQITPRVTLFFFTKTYNTQSETWHPETHFPPQVKCSGPSPAHSAQEEPYTGSPTAPTQVPASVDGSMICYEVH